MSTIAPHKLKKFRESRNLTQKDVIERTVADRTPVSLSTIKRLENMSEPECAAHPRVVNALAKVFGVHPSDLAPESPERSDEQNLLLSGVWLKQKIKKQTDLAFQVVEATYGIPISAQVSLAPLFCALMAEASLQWRKERLEALSLTTDRLNKLVDCDANLAIAFARSREAERIEARSIAARDIVGQRVYDELTEDRLYDPLTADFDLPTFPRDWKSPFFRYLEQQAKACSDAAVSVETPAAPSEFSALDYSIGDKFLQGVHGDNLWAKLALEDGSVRLSEIPPELMAADRASERQEFMAARCTPEAREAVLSLVAEHSARSDGAGS